MTKPTDFNSFADSDSHTKQFVPTHQRRTRIRQLEDDICELAAHIDAATFRWLELIREYDECGGWVGDGIRSSATAPALLYLLHPCSRVRTGLTGSAGWEWRPLASVYASRMR